MIAYICVFAHCQDYLDIERFPTVLKQQQQQQHWKIDMKLCGLPKIEQAIKMGKIEGSAKDSRETMRDESKEESDDGKP